jgi:hypothetical protein
MLGGAIRNNHFTMKRPTFEEMIEALAIDMENAKHIDLSKE